MTEGQNEREIGVADAKRRFSELIDRVQRGERFIVLRHGQPAIALVPPFDARAHDRAVPRGLAAVAGSLGDWEELEGAVEDIYQERRRARDRGAPELE
jgi:prevent-host-death family protein